MSNKPIIYPVFLVNQEGYVYRLHSEPAFEAFITLNDVLNGEFRAWDRGGYLLNVLLINNEPAIRRVGEQPLLEELLNAIAYNAYYWSKEDYERPKSIIDPLFLFQKVEEVIERRRRPLLTKIFRVFFPSDSEM